MVPAEGAAPAPLPPVIEALPGRARCVRSFDDRRGAAPRSADEPTLIEPLEPLAPAVAVPQLEADDGVAPDRRSQPRWPKAAGAAFAAS